MKRSEMREQAFYLTFEGLFPNGDNLDELIELYSENVEEVCTYAKEVFEGVDKNREGLLDIINKFSNSWKADRLPKTTLAILLVALYEIDYVDSVPVNVAINEAVELAKKFAGKEDASFINGVLGAYSRSRE
ncbi:MAG: transcription antitermination factor NusB [Eubacterium sp.]